MAARWVVSFGSDGRVVTDFASGVGQANALVLQPAGSWWPPGWLTLRPDSAFPLTCCPRRPGRSPWRTGRVAGGLPSRVLGRVVPG
ncbi:MAG: hypothetical protein JO345_12135 [Streptosporangiaceae bacterium]|nr:hypothetical protein [Streptosporangiaceae bacterium]